MRGAGDGGLVLGASAVVEMALCSGLGCGLSSKAGGSGLDLAMDFEGRWGALMVAPSVPASMAPTRTRERDLEALNSLISGSSELKGLKSMCGRTLDVRC